MPKGEATLKLQGQHAKLPRCHLLMDVYGYPESGVILAFPVTCLLDVEMGLGETCSPHLHQNHIGSHVFQ